MAPGRVERRDGVPAVEHAARPPLRGAGARRGGERNFSGTKDPSSGMGWPRCSPSRAHLDRSGLGPRSRACLLGPGTQDPSRGRADARGVWVRFVFFFFFPGRNPERTALGFPGAHLGPAPGERSRFLRFPPWAHGTCLVPPESRQESPDQICTESRRAGRPPGARQMLVCGVPSPLAAGEVPGRRKRSALRAVSSRGLHCLVLSDPERAGRTACCLSKTASSELGRVMTWAWGPTSLYRPSREGPGGVQLGLSKHGEPAFGSNRLKFRDCGEGG